MEINTLLKKMMRMVRRGMSEAWDGEAWDGEAWDGVV